MPRIEVRVPGGGRAKQELEAVVASLKSMGFQASAVGTKGRAAMKEMQRGVDDLDNSLDQIKGALAGLGLVEFFRGASTALLEASNQTRQFTTGFAAAAGNSRQGAAEFAFVREEANRLGLELTSTAASYRGLLASAEGTALEGDGTRQVFLGIAEAGAALGLTNEQVEGSLLAVGQMMGKGKVQAEELRGQLAERLPGAFGAMARALGVTQGELSRMLEAGEVLAADSLPKLATELRRMYSAGAASGSNSLNAELNRTKNLLQDGMRTAAAEAESGFRSLFAAIGSGQQQAQLFASAGAAIGSALSTAGGLLRFVIENFDALKLVLLAVVAIKFATVVESWGVALAGLGPKILASIGNLNAYALAAGAALLAVQALIDGMNRAAEAEERATNRRTQHMNALFDLHEATRAYKDIQSGAIQPTLELAEAMRDQAAASQLSLAARLRDAQQALSDEQATYEARKRTLELNQRIGQAAKDAEAPKPPKYDQAVKEVERLQRALMAADGASQFFGRLAVDLKPPADNTKKLTDEVQGLLDRLRELAGGKLPAGTPTDEKALRKLIGLYEEAARITKSVRTEEEKRVEGLQVTLQLYAKQLVSIQTVARVLAGGLTAKPFKPFDDDDPALQAYVDRAARAKELTLSVRTEWEQHLALVAEAADLRKRGLLTEETYLRILGSQRDEIEDATVALTAWQETTIAIAENIDYALGDIARSFVSDLVLGVEDAGKLAFDALVNLAVDAFADMLVSWAENELRMTGITVAQAAKRAAANRAAAQAGFGGGGSAGGSASGFETGESAVGLYSSANAAGLGTAALSAAAFAAVAFAIVSWQKSQKEYWGKLKLAFDETGRAIDQAVPKDGKLGDPASTRALRGMAAEWAKAVREVIEGVGGQLTGLAGSLSLERRGRGKDTYYQIISSVGVQAFRSAEEALQAAIVAGARQAEAAGLAPEVAATLRATTATTLEQLQQELAQAAANHEIAVGPVQAEFERKFREVWAAVRAAVQAGGVDTLLTGLRRDFQAMRRELLGIELAPEQELAERLDAYDRALTAERALAQARIATLSAELAAREADMRAAGAQIETEWQLGMVRAQLAGQESALAGEYQETMARLAAARSELEVARIALGALPGALTPEERAAALARAGRGGGGGGGRRAERESIQDELTRMRESRLPDTLRGWRELNRGLDELAERARRARGPVNEVLAEGNAERNRFRADWRAGLRQGPQGLDGQLAEIRRWYAEQVALAREFGEGMEDVAAGFGERMQDLGQAALGQLGVDSLALEQQFGQLGATLQFVRDNTMELGVTSERWGQITAELGQQLAANMADRLLQFVSDEETRRELEAYRYQLDLANLRLQFALLEQLNEQWQLIDGAILDRMREIMDGIPDTPPAVAPPRPPAGPGVETGSTALEDSNRRLVDALDRLRESQESILLDDRLSILDPQQQLAEARRQFDSLLARARGGDVEAIGDLEGARRALLEAGVDVFDRSSDAYREIFRFSYDAINGILARFGGATVGGARILPGPGTRITQPPVAGGNTQQAIVSQRIEFAAAGLEQRLDQANRHLAAIEANTRASATATRAAAQGRPPLRLRRSAGGAA